MKKEFNDTGVCFPDKHYMVDTSKKISKAVEYIEKGKYFVINRPRQYGKTTTLRTLKNKLDNMGYLTVLMSFEGAGEESYENITLFSEFFLEKIYKSLKLELSNESITNFNKLSNIITEINKKFDKKIILLIDEIDKSSNNQLFIDFLAMLRNKYLEREEEPTFHSIVLAGLHDVKTLKIKLSPKDEAKYNSPWNIAAEFDTDMNFSTEEIETMLIQYTKETGIKINTEEIAKSLFFYTSGYPYFVSKLCKIIDEKLEIKDEWREENIIKALKILLASIGNTNFDTVIKNLENSKELCDFIKEVIFGIEEYNFAIQNPLINISYINGLVKNKDGKVRVHNKIYEEYISDYLISKAETSKVIMNTVQNIYLKSDGHLNIEKVLLKFQEVIQEKYSNNDLLKSNEFLENDLRMLFLVFLKPIINGTGFSFKEVQTSAEKRLDVVILFLDEKFIIELKIWYGEKYHKEGIVQMKEYMEREHVNEGYMIIMNKNKSKNFKQSIEDGIFTVWI